MDNIKIGGDLYKNIYRYIPAKTYEDGPGISVFAHCATVGIVAQELSKYIPKSLEEKYDISKSGLMCALHDIGKASPGFYVMLDKGIGAKDEIEKYYVRRHEITSARWLEGDPIIGPEWADRREFATNIILWHHGSDRSQDIECRPYIEVPKKYGSDLADKDFSRFGYEREFKWESIRREIYYALEEILGDGKEFFNKTNKILKEYYRRTNKSKDIQDNVHVKYLAGFLSVCDWIASNAEYFKPEDYMKDTVDIKQIRADAVSAIEDAGFDKLKVFHNKEFGDVFSSNSIKYTPNFVQDNLHKMITAPGIYTVEAPMGNGKTEAALYAAYKAIESGISNGVYFALPTQLTSDSIFNRYMDFFNNICVNPNKNKDVRLVHSNARFSEVQNCGMHSWFEGNKRGLLSVAALGTVDQAILSQLSGIKHFYMRSYGLSRKVVILDEIHSYDMFTSTLIQDMIKELIELECVVIVLSATLTSKARENINGVYSDNMSYPLITKSIVGEKYDEKYSNEKEQQKLVKIRNVVDSNSLRCALLEECYTKVMDGQMVLWIENTVAAAQDVYEYFKLVKHMGNRAGLLHSIFTVRDRKDNENIWIGYYGKGGDRSLGRILVSTQVCEQSIDIDADFLITAECPSDMLLQRIGRLHRHNNARRSSPECVVVRSSIHDDFKLEADNKNTMRYRGKLGPTGFVYHPYVLRTSNMVMKGVNEISIPGDIRSILEKTYSFNDYDLITKELKNDSEQADIYAKRKANAERYKGFGKFDVDGTSLSDDMPSTRDVQLDKERVVLVHSFNGNDLISTIYGNSICIKKRLNIWEERAINDASISIRKSVLKENHGCFIEVVHNKRKFIIMKLRGNNFEDFTTGKIYNMTYRKDIGFKQ